MSTEHPGPMRFLRHLGILVELSFLVAVAPGLISGLILFDRVVGGEFSESLWVADLVMVCSLALLVVWALLIGRVAKGRSGGYGSAPTRRWILVSMLSTVMLGIAIGAVLAVGANDAWLRPMAFVVYLAVIAFLAGALWLPGRLLRWMDARARAVHARPGSDPRYATAVGQCFEGSYVGRAMAVLSFSFTDKQGQERYFRTLSSRPRGIWHLVVTPDITLATPLVIMYRADDPSRVVHVCKLDDSDASRSYDPLRNIRALREFFARQRNQG